MFVFYYNNIYIHKMLVEVVGVIIMKETKEIKAYTTEKPEESYNKTLSWSKEQKCTKCGLLRKLVPIRNRNKEENDQETSIGSPINSFWIYNTIGKRCNHHYTTLRIRERRNKKTYDVLE